jgi:hypothetical protein
MQGLQTTGLQFAEIIWFELGHIGLRGNPTPLSSQGYLPLEANLCSRATKLFELMLVTLSHRCQASAQKK